MKSLRCLFGRHDFEILAVQPRWELWMMHLGCQVGVHRRCKRCGVEYDFTNPNHERWGPPLPPEQANELWRQMEAKVIAAELGGIQ